MSADATDPDGILTRTGYIHDGCLVDEIDLVDLSDLELDDNDDWLYIPPRCSTESTNHDLYAWLKTEPELDIRDNKKCIDTRTFTRPKRRSARMSFESIFEGLPPSIKGIWKPPSKDVTHTEDEEKSLPVMIEDQESVPLMLKPSAKAAMNASSNQSFVPVSGQESMEAFLNMSQSKGIDSFINLGEPEFSSDLLMNVSQPSLLYMSITSSMNELANLSVIKSDIVPVASTNTDKKDSNVEELSNSSSSINETFVMQTADETIIENSLDRTHSLSKTFCEEPPVQLNRGLNETYDTEAPSEASASRPSLDKEDTDAAALSSTFVTERNVDATFVKACGQADNDIRPLDTTYLSSAEHAEGANLPASTRNDTYTSVARANTADLNVTCDIVTEEIEEPATFLETPADENAFDVSFKVLICNQSTPMNPNVLNPASKLATKRPDQSRQASYPTRKAATSLRRELLAEIQRSGERKLDSTYNHSDRTDHARDNTKTNICAAYSENEIDVPPTNRYNTYRKSTLTAAANQCTSRNETAAAQKELPDQRKFYTFTKKGNNYVEKADSTDTNRNAEQTPRPNLDGTFCKPPPPKAQGRNMRKMLSKLPQFLQKSNPNLVSGSLKAGHTASGLPVGCISNIGYMKGSQPNIVQNIAEKSQLHPSKLHPYGKLKSGSEQRLLEMNVNANSQFPMKGLTAGSTESIESTQSAHSAPDLDDRLSTCSDSSSQNSCTRPAMNIEQLHQLVRMQEESLKQDSAVKPNIRVLENTWVEAKTDLPSPILKNGVGYNEMDRHAMLNTDLSMKCSSPIISPMGSSHALNNDGTSEDNVAKTKDEVTVSDKTEDPDQLVPKVESKTRLRQPTNWGTRSKPATVISGIPRPASRIPALRFARPNAKATQGDLRKGNT
ncbi:uncharacterized protein LOC105287818 isoform X2 [Ooceraea biroi]|nr:uncharacterized protein LOC105287818 isoform X2 [Ooceraea biroi]XP_019889987.1 uncharacterized protein LOC105287818 isoform X2 [Ooceraea biroi]EZA60848.1 hypothetical protein X777_13050 [Ooceraea biroi]